MQQKASYTSLQREAITTAAEKILAHPSFRSSERSTRLFRYLLEQALADEGELLKERRIGHEVFGREAGYDTAADPVVRNAASETRKRLRQYEAESGGNEPVHIQLAPGTYLLDIRFTEAASLQEASSTPVASFDQQVFEPTPSSDLNPAATIPPARLNPAAPRNTRLAYVISLVAVLCCVGLAIALVRQSTIVRQARQAMLAANPLWSPVLSAGKEVFICLGHPDPIQGNDTSLRVATGGLERITLTDLNAYTNFAGFLQSSRQAFQMRIDAQTTLLDLRDRPAILIGDHNNAWSRRLTSSLRYRFNYHEHDGASTNGPDGTPPSRSAVIFDSQQPGRSWQVEPHASDAPYIDYAVAGRVLDPVTGGLVYFVAGAGPVATQAASEFLTRPQFLSALPSSLQNPSTNIQVVLKTSVVAGIPGSPEVVTTYIW